MTFYLLKQNSPFITNGAVRLFELDTVGSSEITRRVLSFAAPLTEVLASECRKPKNKPQAGRIMETQNVIIHKR